MMRVFAAAFAVLSLCGIARAETHWRVHASEGLDAVLFVAALSGDKLQGEKYDDEIARFRPLLTAQEIAVLDRIKDYYATPGRGLAGPNFAYYLAAAPDQSYEGVGAVLDDPVPFIESIGETDSVDAEKFALFQDYSLVYAALKRIGFVAHWRKDIAPVIATRIAKFEKFLGAYDLIPLHEKYLGRDLDATIDVILLDYNKPYGIRVKGQRFVTYHGWDEKITLHTAAHEIFHPPFRNDNYDLDRAKQRLKRYPLMSNIVDTADPAFGYSSFDSILDEDSVQALDKLVGEAIGLATDPGAYWREQDDGMHLLAAAIYDAMKETGFAETGGVYEDWLVDALNNEILSPDAVERRARKIMGDAAVDKWLTPIPHEQR